MLSSTRFRRSAHAGIVAVAVALVAPPAAAQSATGQVSVSGGVATDQRGVRSNALTIAPTLWLTPRAGVSLELGAQATRFDTEQWSLGGGTTFHAREAVGRYALTLSGAASGARLSGPVPLTVLSAELVPAMELRIRNATVFGGVRGAAGRLSEESSAGGFPFNGRTTTTIVNRSGVGPLYGASLRATGDGGRTLTLTVREDRLAVADTTVVDRTLAVAGSQGSLGVALAAGARSAPGEDRPFGSATVSWAFGTNRAIEFAAGRYPSNRILGTPGGQYLSAGLAFRFGGTRAEALPRPSGVRPPARGVTRLAIRAPHARSVEIAGDFNDWKPAPADRAGNGVWYADLRIAPGQYRYAFRLNGSEWRVPDGATAVDDGFGGKSAWVTVTDPGPRR